MKEFKLVRVDDKAVLPKQQRAGDAGFDLYALLDEPLVLPAFTPMAIRTGWKIAIPEGYEGQVRPRSGLAKIGVTVANAPGTIDANYRGELVVLLICNNGDYYTIKPGERIAQLLIKEVPEFKAVEVESFDGQTERGENGFGSSGK